MNDTLCTDLQKIRIVKQAWMFGHENGVLSNDMYAFGIELLKFENTLSTEDFKQVYKFFLIIHFVFITKV